MNDCIKELVLDVVEKIDSRCFIGSKTTQLSPHGSYAIKSSDSVFKCYVNCPGTLGTDLGFCH